MTKNTIKAAKTFLPLSIFLILSNCISAQKSDELTPEEKQVLFQQIMNDSLFIAFIELQEEGRMEIVRGEYRPHRKNITKYTLKGSGSACNAAKLEEVQASEYLTRYFTRACKKRKLYLDFVAKYPLYKTLSMDEKLYLTKEVVERVNPLSTDEIGNMLMNRNQYDR